MIDLAGYKQTDIGLIPSDWDVRKLGDIGESLIGLTYDPSDVRQYGTLVLRSSNIQEGKLSFDDNVYVQAKIPDRIMVKEGDLLVCVRNGSRDLIGKCLLLDERVNGATFGAFMAVFRSGYGKFVHYLFQSELIKKQINEHLGATINQITNRSLNSFLVPLPPTQQERDAIIKALDDINLLEDDLGRAIDKKERLKQAFVQKIFSGNMQLPDFSGKWTSKKLKELVVLNRENIIPASTPSELFAHFSLPAFDQGRTPVVELGSSIGSNKFRVPANSVLISKLNPRISRVWLPNSIPENSVASTEFLVCTPKECISREFLYVLCSSPFFCKKMELAATGTTGSHQRVSPLEALEIELHLPIDHLEQIAISKILNDMDTEIELLKMRYAKTHLLTQGMMQELLTGRTRLV